ncbi:MULTISPECIES: PspC domain-containing protein [unclassified Actinotalea]|uniref:PspC domain-containing protein n=1 Tax=unclassified Actinotalea TaxID=2638618 RepID=UPI0015F58FCB|nr:MULTISPECIES: PspC domain-containing protein [unclassified Actinotalea]
MDEKHDPTARPPGAESSPPPPPPPTGAPPSTGLDSFFDSVRRLGVVRTQDRWIGGVAGGLAARFGIDPLVTRGLLAVGVLLGGLGLVVYAIGWLLLPEQSDGRIHLQQLFRGDVDAAVVGGIAMLVAGLSASDGWGAGPWWGFDLGWWHPLLWVSAVAIVVVLVVTGANRAGPRPTPPAGPAGTRRTEGPVTTLYPNAPSPTSPPYPTGSYPTAPYPTEPYPTAPYATTSTTERPITDDATAAYPACGPSTTAYPTAGPSTTAYPTAASPASSPAAVPYAAPVATRRRPQGPGPATLALVAALALLVFAGLLYASRVGTFTGPVLLTSGAVAVTLLGVAIIVAGLRGRRAGGLGGLAVLLTIVLLPAGTFASSRDDGGTDWSWEGRDGTAVGSVDRTPTSVAEAEAGYSVGAGDVRLDLTELPLEEGETVVVPIEVAAGDVRVVVPQGATVEAEVLVLAGQVYWFGDKVYDGMGAASERTYRSDEVTAGTEPVLRLEIDLAAGRVEVGDGR